MKHLLFIFKITALIAITFFMGAYVAHASGAPELAVTAGVALTALSFIPQGNHIGVLKTITAADIVTEFGAYYKDGGNKASDIAVKLLVRSDTEKLFNRRITKDTIKQGASAQFTEVLQSFQKQWTPKSSVEFIPLSQPLFNLKIDAQEYPDELKESWLAFLADDGLSRKEWPFVRWYIHSLIDKSHEDYETKIIFGGQYVAPVPGTAGAAKDSADGIKVQINRMAASPSNPLNLLALGAVPTDPVDFVNYLEEFESLMTEDNEILAQNTDGYHMSKVLAQRFKNGMRKKYNTNYAQADIVTLIDSGRPVVGLNSHAGSTKIWATPAINRIQYVKGISNENKMSVENIDRLVKIYTDYWKSAGYWNPAWLYTNDVELV